MGFSIERSSYDDQWKENRLGMVFNFQEKKWWELGDSTGKAGKSVVMNLEDHLMMA